MITGDIGETASKLVQNLYKNYLKSDIQFVTHHGFEGPSAILNSYINADVALWQTRDSDYATNKNRDYNKPLQNADATYVAGDRITVITLPYKGAESVTVYPVSQPVYRP